MPTSWSGPTDVSTRLLSPPLYTIQLVLARIVQRCAAHSDGGGANTNLARSAGRRSQRGCHRLPWRSKNALGPRRNAQGGAWCTVLLRTLPFVVNCDVHHKVIRCQLVRCSLRGYQVTNNSLVVTGGDRNCSSQATALPLCAAGIQLTAHSDVSISRELHSFAVLLEAKGVRRPQIGV